MAEKKLTPRAATKKQESTSAWIFRRALKDNKKYKSVDDIISDPVFKKEILSKNGIYPEIDQEWLETFVLQQKKFLEEFSGEKFTEFTRDGGFMTFISKLVKENFGVKKDAWDPADIWCIKDEKKIISDMKKMSDAGDFDTVDQLNAYLRTLFVERKVVGISLKKVTLGVGAAYKEFNIDGKRFKSSKKPNYDVSELNIDFFWDKNKEKFKGNYINIFFKIKENNKEEEFYFKVLSPRLDKFNNLIFSPQSKTHSAAQEGLAPVKFVMEKLNDFGIKNFKNDWKLYPQKLSDFVKRESEYGKMFSYVNSKRFINTGISSEKEFIKSMNQLYLSKAEKYLETANSKLMQLTFVYEISKLPKKEVDELITQLLFLAQKRGKGFGPFGKLY